MLCVPFVNFYGYLGLTKQKAEQQTIGKKNIWNTFEIKYLIQQQQQQQQQQQHNNLHINTPENIINIFVVVVVVVVIVVVV